MVIGRAVGIERLGCHMVLLSVQIRLTFSECGKFSIMDCGRAIQNLGLSFDSFKVGHTLSLTLSWTYKSERASRTLLLLLKLGPDFRDL